MVKSKGAHIASLFPWILYICACVYTYYLISQGNEFWMSYLQAVVLFNGGIQGLWAAVGHLFFPRTTAKSIGWESSGFQTEMGGTNLALGVTGLMTYCHPAWSVPLALVIAIVFGTCAYAHIRDRLVAHNDAPCNSGPMMYNTLLVCITLIVGVVMVLTQQPAAKSSFWGWF